MATAGGEDTRRAERAGLKRKLTGPPRLLLGKASTGSEGEDPPENEDNKEEMENKTKETCSAAAAQREVKLKEDSSVQGEASPTGNCRGRCRNRRRCRWWRRFFSELVCIRRQTKKFEKSSEKHQNDSSVQPEGALQENEEKSEKKMFNKRAWPKFKKSRSSSDEQRWEEQSGGSDHLLNVQKKLHRFFIRKKRPQEETMVVAEAQTDTVRAVTATVEMAIEPVQDGAATDSLLKPTAGETKEEVMEAQPERARSAHGVNDITAGAPPLEIKVEVEVVSPEKVEVFCDSDGAGPDLHNEFLISSEVVVEETAFQTSSENLQAPANGPSIRIELCPQEEEEEEEEECWEASSSSANHRLLLHLLGFDHSEQRLLQMARSLVRAAVNAAVDQLTREQQSVSSCVQRDHA